MTRRFQYSTSLFPRRAGGDCHGSSGGGAPKTQTMSSVEIRSSFLSSVHQEVNARELNEEWDYWMQKGNSKTRSSSRLKDACPHLLGVLNVLRQKSDTGCTESRRKLMATLLQIRKYLTVPWRNSLPPSASGPSLMPDPEVSELDDSDSNHQVLTSDQLSVEVVIIECLIVSSVKQEPESQDLLVLLL